MRDGRFACDKYMYGMCHVFALALHRTFGYDMGLIHDEDSFDYDGEWGTIYHVFCLHPRKSNLGIDCIGIRPIDDILGTYSDSGIEYTIIDEDTLFDLSGDSSEPLSYIDDGAIWEAENFIEERIDKYEVKGFGHSRTNKRLRVGEDDAH